MTGKGIIKAQAKLEKDLRSCMRCKFFYGNDHQCLLKKCIKEESRVEMMEHDKNSSCFECPYRQGEGYCFPCMKKLLEKKEKEP